MIVIAKVLRGGAAKGAAAFGDGQQGFRGAGQLRTAGGRMAASIRSSRGESMGDRAEHRHQVDEVLLKRLDMGGGDDGDAAASRATAG